MAPSEYSTSPTVVNWFEMLVVGDKLGGWRESYLEILIANVAKRDIPQVSSQGVIDDYRGVIKVI